MSHNAMRTKTGGQTEKEKPSITVLTAVVYGEKIKLEYNIIYNELIYLQSV